MFKYLCIRKFCQEFQRKLYYSDTESTLKNQKINWFEWHDIQK